MAANSDWYLYNFRLKLIEQLIARGDKVVLVCPDGPYRPGLEATGAHWLSVDIDRRGLNILRDLLSARRHHRILRQEQPDLVHNFTLKSIVANGLAMRMPGFAATPMINSFEGLGYIYSSLSRTARLARPAVTAILKLVNRRSGTSVIVLNGEDHALFTQKGLARGNQLSIIPGAGVDLERFGNQPAPVPGRFTVLYASRLLRSKGAATLVDAVGRLFEQGKNIVLRIAGTPDDGNPDSIAEPELSAWGKLAYVEMLGHRSDVDQLIRQSSVVVLVSRYAEGVPTILAEAGAAGVPVITSPQGGCREIVEHLRNGLIVPPEDPAALAAAIERLMAEPELAATLGAAGRGIVEGRFAREVINRQIIDIYDRVTAE